MNKEFKSYPVPVPEIITKRESIEREFKEGLISERERKIKIRILELEEKEKRNPFLFRINNEISRSLYKLDSLRIYRKRYLKESRSLSRSIKKTERIAEKLAETENRINEYITDKPRKDIFRDL